MIGVDRSAFLEGEIFISCNLILRVDVQGLISWTHAVVVAKGTQAAFTGTKPDDFKGHIIGKDVVVAGNILVGRETLEAMVAAFENTPGPLADRVMTALEAGQKAGADRRGKISAAIVVLNEAPSTNGYARNIDLRIDNSKDPVAELRTLFDAYKTAFKIK